MKNFVKAGKTLPFTMAGAVSSGDVVEVGSFIGVCQADAASGERVEVLLEGVVELPRDAVAFTEGQLAYWDGAQVSDVVGGGNTVLGAASEAALSGAAVLQVRLDGVAK
jgi:predicted RecA/RadA family phage recombinase